MEWNVQKGQSLLWCVMNIVVHRMDYIWIPSTETTYNGSTLKRSTQKLHTVRLRPSEPWFILTLAQGRKFSGSEFTQRISSTAYGFIQYRKYNTEPLTTQPCYSRSLPLWNKSIDWVSVNSVGVWQHRACLWCLNSYPIEMNLGRMVPEINSNNPSNWSFPSRGDAGARLLKFSNRFTAYIIQPIELKLGKMILDISLYHLVEPDCGA